jgi:hypothetical protein
MFYYSFPFHLNCSNQYTILSLLHILLCRVYLLFQLSLLTRFLFHFTNQHFLSLIIRIAHLSPL